MIDSHFGQNQILCDCCGKGHTFWAYFLSQTHEHQYTLANSRTYDKILPLGLFGLILTYRQQITNIQTKTLVLCACTYCCGRRHTLGLFSQLPCNAEEPSWLTRSRKNDEENVKRTKKMRKRTNCDCGCDEDDNHDYRLIQLLKDLYLKFPFWYSVFPFSFSLSASSMSPILFSL